MQRKSYSIRLHPKLEERLNAEAAAAYLNRSEIIVIALKHYLDHLDLQRRRGAIA